MKYFLPTCIIISLSFSLTFAQTNVEDKLGSWSTFAGNHKISDKLSIGTCAQLWLYEVEENFNFILLSTGLNYHITPKLTTTLAYGYADIDSGFNKDGSHTYENRIFEQITYKHKISNLPVDHRLRAEQRFLDKPTESKMYNRLRYRLGTKITLNKTLFIRLHNEFLTTLKKDLLNENRLYGALGIYLFDKSTNVQLGYLNRRIKDLNLHRLQIGVFIKTNHRKNK